jgi:hypothetical protein
MTVQCNAHLSCGWPPACSRMSKTARPTRQSCRLFWEPLAGWTAQQTDTPSTLKFKCIDAGWCCARGFGELSGGRQAHLNAALEPGPARTVLCAFEQVPQPSSHGPHAESSTHIVKNPAAAARRSATRRRQAGRHGGAAATESTESVRCPPIRTGLLHHQKFKSKAQDLRDHPASAMGTTQHAGSGALGPPLTLPWSTLGPDCPDIAFTVFSCQSQRFPLLSARTAYISKDAGWLMHDRRVKRRRWASPAMDLGGVEIVLEPSPCA